MKHKEFIGNMHDEANCNQIMMKILSPEITEQWKEYMKLLSIDIFNLP